MGRQEEQVQQYRPLQALVPQGWMSTTVAANGVEQHYWRTGGRKAPLVLLHGFMEAGMASPGYAWRGRLPPASHPNCCVTTPRH